MLLPRRRRLLLLLRRRRRLPRLPVVASVVALRTRDRRFSSAAPQHGWRLCRRPLAADRCNQTNQAVADLCAEVASQPNAQLFVSLLEIYNERATDLLAEPCGGNGGDGGGDSSRRRRPPLRVRECPERGRT